MILQRFEENQVKEFLGILGPTLAQKLVIIENQSVSNSKDHNLIGSYFNTILNCYDKMRSREICSFEQLKSEAFKQFSSKHKFSESLIFESTVGPGQVLFNLDILFDSSDPKFTDPFLIDSLGLQKLFEFFMGPGILAGKFKLDYENWVESLENPDGEIVEILKFLFCVLSIFLSTENGRNLGSILQSLCAIIIPPKLRDSFKNQLVQVILRQNTNLQSIFHILAQAQLKNNLLIELIDRLKAQFGFELITKILILKDNGGHTFWNRNIFEKIDDRFPNLKFNGLLVELLESLRKSDGNDDEFKLDNLSKFARNSVFEENEFGKANKKIIENFYDKNPDFKLSDTFRIVISITKDIDVKFTDSSFRNYFGLMGFHKLLINNYKSQLNLKLFLKMLKDRSKYRDFCWLIEKFYEEKLSENKLNLHEIAQDGEKNNHLLFLLLEILLNRLKVDPNTYHSLLVQNDKSQTFLQTFCGSDFLWRKESYTKLFEKIKEFKSLFPEDEFKKFISNQDISGWNFLSFIRNSDLFEATLNFPCSEFDIDFAKTMLTAKDFNGVSLSSIKPSIVDFTKLLELLKKFRIDKKVITEILMQKVLNNDVYTDPNNFDDFKCFLNTIFTNFRAEKKLFHDLFDPQFLNKLTDRYKKEKRENDLNFILDLIKKENKKVFFR
jgi:hypothetical protein